MTEEEITVDESKEGMLEEQNGKKRQSGDCHELAVTVNSEV